MGNIKNTLWLIVIVLGICIWTYKVFNASQAYFVAKSAIENRSEIDDSLGQYDASYDWWFGVFRALRYSNVQKFEFHLDGVKADAVGMVEVTKNAGIWEATCISVVNGEYLNNRITHDCNG